MVITEPTRNPANILLATDLSSRSDRALERSLQLAREWHVKLHILHVIPEETGFGMPSRTWEAPWREMDEQREQVAHQLRQDIGTASREVEIQTHVERGSPGEIILSIAERENCDLIVSGVARNETLGRRLLGDTVDHLLRETKVPVLVVRNRVHGAYEEVLSATDFSPASAEALQRALELFPRSRISLFHAYQIPFAGILTVNDAIRSEFRDLGEKATREFLRKVGLPEDFPIKLQLGWPAEELAKYLEDHDALVVAGSHGVSAVARVLLGSTASRILDRTQADVLLVPFTGRKLT